MEIREGNLQLIVPRQGNCSAEENGNPKSIVIGERNYRLLCIPPMCGQ